MPNNDLEHNLNKSLRRKERLRRLSKLKKESSDQNKVVFCKNKYVDLTVVFLLNILFLYLLLELLKFLFLSHLVAIFGLIGIQLAWINPLLHGAVWIIAIISSSNKTVLFRLLIPLKFSSHDDKDPPAASN